MKRFISVPYTKRQSVGFGLFMLMIGVVLLFLRTSIRTSTWPVATGSLAILGGLLLLIGPTGSWIGVQSLSETWCLTTGVGSILIGLSLVLIPVFHRTIALIGVGLLGGIALIGQGIVTVRAQPEME
ncbi:hypothetical protein ACFQL7_23950 [Halocatena marina]|uniref:SxtJ n=1 Tax=Halocatena marina TaxID=2934937 RepID=A0ABD5YUF4_9EURY